MTEQTCRWDREAQQYLRDGAECRWDDYGDPTRHCEARRGCANHVGPREITCARCMGRTRQDIRAIVRDSLLMLPEAIETGVRSQAAYLAGPACDVEAWSWRKIAARQGRAWHASLPVELGGDPHHVEEDDDRHPFTVLTRWQWELSIAYGHPFPDVFTTQGAAEYLDRNLPRLAQDPDQEFVRFAKEIRKCRSHMEGVRRNSQAPERGAPCPICDNPAPRLVREYGHWCDDPECDRLHYADDSGDRWVCPRNRAHEWSEADYRLWVADVYEANRPEAS